MGKNLMNPSDPYDVIVIGAGIAGLKATQYLVAQGRRVLLLEARNRVGGRIHTLQTTDGHAIEMGSTLLQNPGISEKLNPLIPLLQPLGIQTTILDNHNVDPAFNLQDIHLNTYAEKVYQKIQAAKKRSCYPLPVLAEIFQDESNPLPQPGTPAFLEQQIMHAMITHHTGAALNQISIAEWMLRDNSHILHTNWSDTNTVFISGGYQKLPEAMLQSALETKLATIQLNTPVCTIYHDPTEAFAQVITKSHQAHYAKHILCTVPLGVLKNHHIQFIPELSQEKQHLIQILQIGHQNKIILEFEKLFWKEDAHLLYPGSDNVDQWPEYINLFHFSQGKTITLICNVYAKAAQFKHLSEKKIIAQALLPLQKYYGKRVTSLKTAMITHWDSETYTLGSTSCCGIHSHATEINHFAIPEQGNLYFAGAHTLMNTDRETVLGAYQSGLRAALDIITSF